VCFSITPRGSQLLRGLLAKGAVRVRANVDSRYFTGVYPYVTGVIRGSDGANAEEVLNRLIASGKRPRPKRSIRVLAMGECYGTNYYLEHHKERVQRTVAAMCIDSPAGSTISPARNVRGVNAAYAYFVAAAGSRENT
jgi:hypothetical protein